MKSIFAFAAALAAAASPALSAPKVCAECVRENMERLAGPEARGRGCGTADEHAAAQFLAERFKTYGVKGAGPDGGYLQTVQFKVPTYAQAPSLTAGALRVQQGGEMLAISPAASAVGALMIVGKDVDPATTAGKVVLYDAPFDQRAAMGLLRAGALAVVAAPPPAYLGAWTELASRPPPGVEVIGAENTPPAPRTLVFLKPDTLAALRAMAGQTVTIAAPRGEPVMRTTYNVIGAIPGTAEDAGRHAVLLTAHYDHLGVRDGKVYPGANDDASGTAAVLEFARMLGKETPAKRTVQFALFGCEEQGGHGAKAYLAHPPLPLTDISANLEFEMIGLPDPKHPKTLMLTGWERTNLGPTLKEQGADIGPDPYPEQNFFQRSDNYQLALKGLVAQTVSAWPVPPTYHQPTDDLAHVDLGFMAEVIQSLVAPIQWLSNSDFRPAWNEGMKP